MPRGLIVKGIGGFYYVRADNTTIECKVRGVFRKQGITPMVGDNVLFELNSDNKGIITDIYDRNNFIIRPPVSNIDQVIIVFSILHPTPNYLFIDRLIAFLESKGIGIVICINKIDLDLEKSYIGISSVYKKIGYPVVNTSTKKGIGIDELKNSLKGKISCFAGSSGVGKSTLLNIILNKSAVQTGELSRKIERGKHTTRHVELFELQEGGFILDTPGFSSLDLSTLKKDKLQYLFIEFQSYIPLCRFVGCSHINEPGCAVKQAVQDSYIDSGRYERYKQIYNELEVNNYYR